MMSEKVDYTTTQKRMALAAAHQVLTQNKIRYRGKHFCGDMSFGIDIVINIISELYQEALENEDFRDLVTPNDNVKGREAHND